MYGSFLREIRESRRLTQSQLASIVGIDQPNLSAYEQDRRTPTLETLNRLTEACGYRLCADAGGRRIHCPLPGDVLELGWRPLPGDPPDEQPAVDADADPRRRGEALESLLKLAEASGGPTRGHR